MRSLRIAERMLPNGHTADSLTTTLRCVQSAVRVGRVSGTRCARQQRSAANGVCHSKLTGSIVKACNSPRSAGRIVHGGRISCMVSFHIFLPSRRRTPSHIFVFGRLQQRVSLLARRTSQNKQRKGRSVAGMTRRGPTHG